MAWWVCPLQCGVAVVGEVGLWGAELTKPCLDSPLPSSSHDVLACLPFPPVSLLYKCFVKRGESCHFCPWPCAGTERAESFTQTGALNPARSQGCVPGGGRSGGGGLHCGMASVRGYPRILSRAQQVRWCPRPVLVPAPCPQPLGQLEIRREIRRPPSTFPSICSIC